MQLFVRMQREWETFGKKSRDRLVSTRRVLFSTPIGRTFWKSLFVKTYKQTRFACAVRGNVAVERTVGFDKYGVIVVVPTKIQTSGSLKPRQRSVARSALGLGGYRLFFCFRWPATYVARENTATTIHMLISFRPLRVRARNADPFENSSTLRRVAGHTSARFVSRPFEVRVCGSAKVFLISRRSRTVIGNVYFVAASTRV